MTYYSDDLPMRLRAPSARRLVEHQRQQLKMFDDVEFNMRNLWECYKQARGSASGKRRRIPVDGDQLQNIVDACEEGVLAQVPEGSRILLSMEATDRTNGYVADWMEALSDMTVYAHTEIGLRVLIHLALKSAGHAYGPELRLPAWDRAITAAASKVATTVDSWRSFVDAEPA